jgi:DNA-binding response OmpR family regulator
MDQSLHVLVVVGGEREGKRLERLLQESGMVCEITQEITPEHLDFARHLGDVAVIVGTRDPIAELFYLGAVGVDLPVVILQDGGPHGWDAQLLQAGAAACAPMPRSQRALFEILASAARSAPRRTEAKVPSDIVLDPVVHTARRRDAAVTLSRREYALLDCLVSRAGQPTSIARLKAYAWGNALPKRSGSQIVTVYIHQLRRKLATIGLPNAIVTVRNFGYAFTPSVRCAVATTRSFRGAGDVSPSAASTPEAR